MAYKLQAVNTDKIKKPKATGIGVLWGTAAPDNGNGSNGDYYFRTNDGTESIYKKASGAWAILAGGFTGWITGNSQGFVKTANFTEITPTNFSIDGTSRLQVEVDGMIKYLTRDYTIDTGKVVFNSTIEASASVETYVFIGKYN